MRTLYFVSLFFHLLSATVWIGGMLFLVLVLVPLLHKPEYKAQAGRLIQLTGEKFRFWGWVALMIFLVTGYYNLSYRFQSFTAFFQAETWQGYWGRALMIKLTLFGIILVLSALHDFYIGPKATKLMEQQPDHPDTIRLRRLAGLIGRANLLLAFMILILATVLVRGVPW